MNVLGWSRPPARREIKRIPADSIVYVISDLHLGDGTPSDTFLAKDRQLLELIAEVEREDATLVVAGDAIDFAQGWTFARILRAHGEVLRKLSELADRGRMIYIFGNHDHNLQLFQYVLRFPVVAGVEIGQEALILHGYEYDWLIGPDLRGSEINTMAHHMVERMLNAWIRPPLEMFYTVPNRFAYWVMHKIIWLNRRWFRLRRALGDSQAGAASEAELAYWLRSELGDPGDMYRPATRALETGPHRTLVCGHSHLPGLVTLESGRRYVNTGSWTFNSSTYLRMAPGELQLRDWISGKEYDDRLYKPVIRQEFDHLTFEDWWADQYMGLLRFRSGEERNKLRPPWMARPAVPPPEAEGEIDEPAAAHRSVGK
jgi:UDP-2,3-diacylglucosamine pyrophosphatase LpxH